MGEKNSKVKKETAKKSDAMDFFGVLKNSKNLEEMEKDILEQRKVIDKILK